MKDIAPRTAVVEIMHDEGKKQPIKIGNAMYESNAWKFDLDRQGEVFGRQTTVQVSDREAKSKVSPRLNHKRE